MADPVSLAFTIAMTAAQMAITASRKIEGPRSDVKITSGDYGVPLTRGWGTRRVAVPIIWAEELREVHQERKTKGGKFNDYTYFGTWAVAVACHEIAGVTRIWFDSHLVYDMTGAGPVSAFDFGEGAGGIEDYIAIYPGSETQLPDPRMQASIEAEFGEGSCPAYRGIATIVFKDVPVEKFGNRLPQVNVEFASVTAASYPDDQAARTLTAVSNVAFAPDFSRLVTLGRNGGLDNEWIEVYDVAARASIMVANHGAKIRAGGNIGVFADGTVYAAGTKSGGSAGSNLTAITPDGTASEVLVFDAAHNSRGIYVLADGDGTEHWFSQPSTSGQPFYMDGTLLEIADLAPFAGEPFTFFSDGEDLWCAGATSGNLLFFLRLVTVSETTAAAALLTGITLTASLDPVEACWCESAGHFVAVNKTAGGAADVWAVDPAGATVATAAWTWTYRNDDDVLFAFLPVGAGSASLYLGGREFSLSDLSTIRTLDYTDWNALTHSSFAVFDPVNRAIAAYQTSGPTEYTSWLYLDRIGSPGVTLAEIADDVLALAGADVAMIDTTALTQVIPGYSVSSGAGRDWLEPLIDLYDVDARPHGFALQFVNRGASPGGTIASTRFALPGDGQALYGLINPGGTDVPKQINLGFADIAADQQPNSAKSPPVTGLAGSRILSLDLGTLALDVDSARQLVARYHRRVRFDRKGWSLALTARDFDLEPGDVRTLVLGGSPVIARLHGMVLDADRRIETEWRRDDPSVALLDGASGATFDGRDPSVVVVPLLSRGFTLDLPLLRDADSSASPLLYVAAAPWAAGSWPGATMYQAVDGEYSDELAGVASTAQATWGYATDALADTALPGLWDRGSSVNIRLQVGTLTGTTEAAIDANPRANLCLIGDELVNFTTATLEGDGTYTLSGFKRGRRGTEWATTGHAARDVFLLLDTAAPAALGLSEVGTSLSFKAVTAGRSASGAYPIAVAPFTGASLKPYSPVHLAGARDAGTGDWALEWVRRTRVGGAWTSGTTIPLSEASEEYEVEIMDGATVKRTFTGLTSPAASYTAAQQTTDWGSGQTSITFRVYQISDAVGRGFVATATA